MTETTRTAAPVQQHGIPKYAATLITISTSFVVRKGLIEGYRAVTGKPAPTVQSKDAPIVAKVLWSAMMASMVTLIESIVLRAVHEELVTDDPDAIAQGALEDQDLLG